MHAHLLVPIHVDALSSWSVHTRACARARANDLARARTWHLMQAKTALTDPKAAETADVLLSMKQEADERLAKLTSIFTKREYERVERERELLREVVAGSVYPELQIRVM